eukprot:CAMPEP_0177573542 /NCGR_PEP_ID=MMETSP0369-20130122/78583_1 /TAXON_ID=447022 ORGANISM="Scrippsiella hangoei-like, Strain SHHI-4" /NCGR_SAMPLE_ID=MMETSP0369 /ASSEMBLY_ACC=CAM_ASM_000364 /LENGTH=48 /DNA_ID= /DNA_START= /DNA_END= /DNA_ORIENTATION=
MCEHTSNRQRVAEDLADFGHAKFWVRAVLRGRRGASAHESPHGRRQAW